MFPCGVPYVRDGMLHILVHPNHQKNKLLHAHHGHPGSTRCLGMALWQQWMHLQGKPFTTHQSGMDYSNLHVICVKKGQKLCMIPMMKNYNQTTSPDPEHAWQTREPQASLWITIISATIISSVITVFNNKSSRMLNMPWDHLHTMMHHHHSTILIISKLHALQYLHSHCMSLSFSSSSSWHLIIMTHHPNLHSKHWWLLLSTHQVAVTCNDTCMWRQFWWYWAKPCVPFIAGSVSVHPCGHQSAHAFCDAGLWFLHDIHLQIQPLLWKSWLNIRGLEWIQLQKCPRYLKKSWENQKGSTNHVIWQWNSTAGCTRTSKMTFEILRQTWSTMSPPSECPPSGQPAFFALEYDAL